MQPASQCMADSNMTERLACSLDTGRLNPETYQLFDAVEKHYGIRIEYTFPDAQECMDFVRTKGMFSFYDDGHQECCRVRKVLQSQYFVPKSALAAPSLCVEFVRCYNHSMLEPTCFAFTALSMLHCSCRAGA